MKNTGIKVKIFNSEYNLMGENPDEVKKIANYVDTTMLRISSSSSKISTESLAVVSALNITESLFKEKELRRDSEKEYIEFLKDSITRIEDLTRLIEHKL